MVALAGSLLFAHRGGPPDLRVSGTVHGTPTPTAQRPDTERAAALGPAAFGASGSWTMSSLPGCFFEQDHLIGSVARLRAKFPPAGERVAPGTSLRSGDCTVHVRPRELWIVRGDDRLRVPPDARLYRRGDRLTLVFVAGQHAEIRHYCRAFDAVRCPPQTYSTPPAMRI